MGLCEGKIDIEQLVIQITEKWRIAVDRKLLVGILFVAFTRAFDTVSHNIFLQSCMILKSEEIYGCGWATSSHDEDSLSESTDVIQAICW